MFVHRARDYYFQPEFNRSPGDLKEPVSQPGLPGLSVIRRQYQIMDCSAYWNRMT